jgi:hypothetical protein
MTEDVLFVCKDPSMSENEETRGTVVELLLRDPDVVAWLEDYRPQPDAAPDDDEPPRAA